MSDSGVDLEQINRNKNKNIDESDLSSTEDYKFPSDENSLHSSSSMEKISPYQVKRRVKSRQNLRHSHLMDTDDAINELKYLHQRITKQKMLIMQNLETDCSKEEINKQIAVLQELQLQYMKIKINLQHLSKDCEMNSPIEHSPSETSVNKSLLSPAYEHPLQDTLEPMSPTSFLSEERNLGRRRSTSPMIFSSYLTVCIFVMNIIRLLQNEFLIISFFFMFRVTMIITHHTQCV